MTLRLDVNVGDKLIFYCTRRKPRRSIRALKGSMLVDSSSSAAMKKTGNLLEKSVSSQISDYKQRFQSIRDSIYF